MRNTRNGCFFNITYVPYTREVIRAIFRSGYNNVLILRNRAQY